MWGGVARIGVDPLSASHYQGLTLAMFRWLSDIWWESDEKDARDRGSYQIAAVCSLTRGFDGCGPIALFATDEGSKTQRTPRHKASQPRF